jgi:Mat/Ecp fimbriae major subunit
MASIIQCKFAVIALFALGTALSPGVAFAESTPGSAVTVIHSPVTIDLLSNINFGPVVAGVGNGQVELNVVDGNRYCYTTAVCLPGSHSFAEFRIIGSGMVNVDYPSQIPFTGPAGPDMFIDLQARHIGGSVFAPNSAVPVDADGEIVRIGGWLHMNPNQPEGTYSGSFTLTADYY